MLLLMVSEMFLLDFVLFLHKLIMCVPSTGSHGEILYVTGNQFQRLLIEQNIINRNSVGLRAVIALHNVNARFFLNDIANNTGSHIIEASAELKVFWCCKKNGEINCIEMCVTGFNGSPD